LTKLTRHPTITFNSGVDCKLNTTMFKKLPKG